MLKPLARKLGWMLEQPATPARTVAHRAGVTPSAVHEWRRTGRIAKRHLPLLAQLTGTRVDWWLHDDAPIPPSLEWMIPTSSEVAYGSSLAAGVPSHHAASLRPGEMWLSPLSGLPSGGDVMTQGLVTLIRVTEETLQKRLAATPCSGMQNLRLIAARGISMQPTFSPGDVLIVDAGVLAIDEDGVYVYSRGPHTFIRRLQIEGDGSIRVIADNPAFRDSAIPSTELGQYDVHGRVIASWSLQVHA